MGPTSSAKEPMMRDVERVRYDLSHWSMKVGAIGRLQTLSCIPIVAGDSFAIDMASVIRLSPLRRNLYLDARVDLFAFYVRHRHIYGDNWIDFIKSGFDEAVTLGTDTMAAGVKLQCVGLRPDTAGALPRWLSRGYIQIWNRYFRDPSDVAGLLAEDYFTTLASTDDITGYGIKCAHLKRIWNSALLSTLASGDYSLPLSGGEVNLYELAALKGRLKSEIARDFFATRYQDILHHSWGSSLNVDADKRPELVMHSQQWLSGYDVDGTDDATLGTYSGKAQTVAHLSVPKKFFPEHGTLWLMGLLRFPPIHDNESHYLALQGEPSYAQISGDPAIVRTQKPFALDLTDVFADAGSVALGSSPYAQWFREHPNSMHLDYTISAGHPFLTTLPTTRNEAVYITPSQYDQVFQSTQLKHWNAQSFVSIVADRFVPDPRVSIFAGSE